MIRGLCKIFCALTMFIMSMTIITTDLLGMRLNQSQQNAKNVFVIVLPTKMALHPDILSSMLSTMCNIQNYPLDPLSFQSENVKKQLEYCGILSLFDYDSFIVYADPDVSEYLRNNGLSVVNRKLKTLLNDPQNPLYGDVELSRLNDTAIRNAL